MEGGTDLYALGIITLTAIRHQDEISGPTVELYAGALGSCSRFLLAHEMLASCGKSMQAVPGG